jgi:hypothetical protein
MSTPSRPRTPARSRTPARPSMDVALAKLREFEAEVALRNRLRRSLATPIERSDTGEAVQKRRHIELSETEHVSETEHESESETEYENVSETEHVSETEPESETELVSDTEEVFHLPRQDMDWRPVYLLYSIFIALYFIYIGISVQRILDSTK